MTHWSVACILVCLGLPSVPEQQRTQARPFEEELDSRLHSNLVIRPKCKHFQVSSKSSLHPTPVLSVLAKVNNAPSITSSTISALPRTLVPSQAEPSNPATVSLSASGVPLSNAARQREKKCILDGYQSKFGASNSDAPPIISCKRGKPVSFLVSDVSSKIAIA